MSLPELDLTIRNATIVTAAQSTRGDVGVRDGRIAIIADKLEPAAHHGIDAAGNAFPGGIDSHCHVEQLSASGLMTADDFTPRHRLGGARRHDHHHPLRRAASRHGVAKVVADYHACAGPKAVIDYNFHLIVSDPTPKALNEDLPALIRQGYTSFKVYMTYDKLKLDDGQLLDVADLAGRAGALVMVHAENNEVIKWIAQRLLANGNTAPKFHAVAHDPLAESEATHRVISSRACSTRRCWWCTSPASGRRATSAPRRPLGRAGVRRDLPAIPVPQGQRHRPAGAGWRDVLLQPAAARRSLAGGDLGRLAKRHLPGLFVRPRALPF